MQALLTYTILWVPVSAMLFAQLLQPCGGWARYGDFDLRAIMTAGGMPSSHSAMVSSLATVLAFEQGLDSPLFAIAVILAIIVMSDARGVRQESGKQARILNRLVRELFRGQPLSEEELKELLGHTASEVVIGAFIGVSYALIFLALSVP
jgi:acid phosphatase family membrane protein YuiD